MEVHVLNRQRRHRVSARGLAGFLGRVAGEIPPGDGRSLGLCLVSDRKMREFNRTFRGRDSSTDVLSFPASGDPDPEGECYLGDIVISVPRAASQAAEAGHSLARELRVLALHGYLHLLGYDHEADAGEMSRLERNARRKLLPVSRSRRKPT
jgi:probable rRNA maturation factor